MTAIQELADRLAELLGMPVGIDDRQFRSVAYSSHADEIDPVRRMSILGRQAPEEVTNWLLTLGIAQSTEYVRVPGNQEMRMVPRVCVPLRFHDRLLGYLWLIEKEGQLPESLLTLAVAGAGTIAEELYRLELVERDEQRVEEEAVRALTEAGRAVATTTAAPLAAGTHRTVAVVAVVDAGEHDVDVRLRAAVHRLHRSVPPRQALSLVEHARAVVVLAGTEADIDRAATRMLSFSELELADLPQASAVVGLGIARTALTELPASRHEAELAAQVASSAAGRGPIARFAELEAYQLIAELAADRDRRALIPPSLSALLADPDAGSLILTVETYLERGGDAASTARELFIHRSSLYNRLHRVEELAGIDMRSGADRLTLHLGLRLWRLSRPSTSVESVRPNVRRAPTTEGRDGT